LYSSPNIITMIRSRRMGWAGHAAHVQKTRKGEMRAEVWLENLKEWDHWEDLGVDGRILLRQS
jgi:hypothetical protein